MGHRLPATSPWRVVLPLALVVFLAGPGVSWPAQGSGSAVAAVRATPPAISGVCDPVLDGADGFRDELRRDGGDLAASRALRGMHDRRERPTAAGRLPGGGFVGTAAGVLLSRLSGTMARWKGVRP
jgi:hypothetical protein